MSGNAAAVLKKPGFRKIEWLKRDIDVERRPDGVIVLKSRIPLQAYEKHIPASLAKWARQAPERIWLAQRVFRVAYVPPLGALAASALAAAVLVALAGWLGTRRIAATSPLLVLRRA